MFINDVSDALKCENNDDINLTECVLDIILSFADDIVILSETRTGLQNGSDKLGKYCNKLGLEDNINKTKCVPFKKRGRLGK